MARGPGKKPKGKLAPLPPPAAPGYRKEDKRYWCNCVQRCNGIMRERDKKTFGRHKGFREAGTSSTMPPYTLPTSTTEEAPNSEREDGQHDQRGYSADSEEGEGEDMQADGWGDETLDAFLQSSMRDRDGVFGSAPGQDAYDVPGNSRAPNAAPNNDVAGSGETSEDTDTDSSSSEDTDSDDETVPIVTLQDLKISLSYVQWIKEARHEDTGMTDEEITRLLNPPKCLLDLSNDPDLELCIGLYIDLTKTSQKAYDKAMARLQGFLNLRDSKLDPCQATPEPVTFYTYAQVRSAIRELTGVVALKHDMCCKSCMAYTGPLQGLRNCVDCHEPRYRVVKGKDVPRQQFYTIPVGPQLQAALRSFETGKLIQYRLKETKKTLDACVTTLPDGTHQINVPTWGDYIHGHDYLTAVLSEDIREDDLILMLSIDGAQLYESKKSDCWIYIWVLMDLPPQYQYKKRYVMPGGFIPGPNKPKNVQSFIFSGLQHLSALQKDGLPIWNPARADIELEDPQAPTTYISHPWFHSGTADGPGLAYLHCRCGHHGYFGCRHWCPVPGRRFEEKSNTYYPALLKPLEKLTPESNHPDVSIPALLDTTSQTRVDLYEEKLELVLKSRSMAKYIENRRDTGIASISMFSGLSRRFNILSIFPSDLMHLTALNITDVIMALFRGMMEVGPGDDVNMWDWAVLTGETWTVHGALVASFKRHLNSSIDRPPRDPSKKINSGYKAMEFLTYVYGMLPALLYGVLPEPYYSNFCKLVFGIRIISQREITADQLQQAHRAFTEFVIEFEEIYVQQKASRIHFIRQCIHNLIHLCPETIRSGPLSLLAQWLMERTIGNLGEEIKQPSNPYKNLSERGLRRAQTNAMISMLDLEPPPPPPSGSVDLGEGYFLMNPTARSPVKMTNTEMNAFLIYARQRDPEFRVDHRGIRVLRKGRVRLPTQQVGRTAWKEDQKSADAPLRISRMVRILLEYEDENGDFHSDIFIGEVAYFFEAILNGESEGLAMVSICEPPDYEILKHSKTTLWVTRLTSGENVHCISISDIISVVSLLPYPHIPGTHFLYDNLGLDVTFLDSTLFANGEDDPDIDDNDD